MFAQQGENPFNAYIRQAKEAARQQKLRAGQSGSPMADFYRQNLQRHLSEQFERPKPNVPRCHDLKRVGPRFYGPRV